MRIGSDAAKARLHIGVDVSKDKLDVFVPPEWEGAHAVAMTVDNSRKGFEKVRDFAMKFHAIVCLEPTGGYECGLIVYLHKYDVEVARVDALRVRRFAEAEGTLQKNDRADAALISRFADKMSALSSLIWNARLAAYYRKKRAEGHPHKWAMVSTMRKLLSLLNKIATKPDFVPLPEPDSTKANAKVGRKKKSA